MSEPTISVVMPTYNEAEYVERAVASIRAQTFSDFEIVVVDDGSTDGTVELVQAFEDDRIRVVRREGETGITSALNRGVGESSGRYVARHDADDWSHPKRFERQVEVLEARPELALLGTGAYLVDATGDTIGRRRVLERPGLRDLLEHNEFVHGSVVMNREALQSVGGYDEWFETTEDYDLWIRLAEEYPVGNVDEPLYYFRQHDESIYGSDLERLKLYHVVAARRATDEGFPALRRRIETDGIEVVAEDLTGDERAWLEAELAREFLRYGDLEASRKRSRRAIAARPTGAMLYPMYALSYTTPGVARSAARAYRRVLNASIRIRNWRRPIDG